MATYKQVTAQEFRSDPSYHSEQDDPFNRYGWKMVSVFEPWPFDGYVWFCSDGLAWVEGDTGLTPLYWKDEAESLPLAA